MAQDSVTDNTVVNQAPDKDTESKRLFYIIPNNRTAPSFKDFTPITSAAKFKIATQDSFDPGTVALAALFAGQSQLVNANPSFRQGASGYGHYFATQYSDLVIGDYLTEGVFPTLLHQDPRYFRKGTGSGWSRLGYSMGQIFISHNDAGKTVINWSELGGNASAVAISMSYYPDNRTAKDAGVKFATQLGVDMFSNILKEFWPEINRKLSRKRR